MKKTVLHLVLFALVVTSCCSTKTTTQSLYDGAWELEYITGPKIAFDGLYPDKKPYLIFNQTDHQFSGNTGCNLYSGKYTQTNNAIHFGEAIKTMIYCEGGGEETFLKMLGKVNQIDSATNGKLILLSDGVPMMRFKKIAKP